MGGELAGLGVRLGAFAFDYLPILAYLTALVGVGAALGRAFPEAVAGAFAGAASAQAIGFATVTLPAGLYFALSEASTRQATWGKRRLRLQVVGPGARRLGLRRSLARTALKFVPWELAHGAVWGFTLAGDAAAPGATVLLILTWVGVGANVAAIARSRRTLYDLLAGTSVVRVP